MLESVLDKAKEMSIYGIRAFVHMRKELAISQEEMKRLVQIDKKLLEHDDTPLNESLLPCHSQKCNLWHVRHYASNPLNQTSIELNPSGSTSVCAVCKRRLYSARGTRKTTLPASLMHAGQAPNRDLRRRCSPVLLHLQLKHRAYASPNHNANHPEVAPAPLIDPNEDWNKSPPRPDELGCRVCCRPHN